MSVRIMTMVWALDLPDSDKIVLLALADCANDEGHCWPSIRTLTAKCSKTDRTIQSSIKRLVEGGYLIRREVPGKGCNYTVKPNTTPEITSPRNNFPPKGTTQTPEAVSDKPSRTINSETKVSSERVQQSYNRVTKASGFIESKVLDASLKQKIRLRVNEHGEDGLTSIFELAAKASWLRGEGRESTWRPDLEYLLRPATIRKLLEGGYGQDKFDNSAKWTPEQMAAYAAKLRSQTDVPQTAGSLAKKILGDLH